MGGGSAQVNPPYQVSVAEGLTALLGDAVTVTDGVEVRNRPVAGPRQLRHRPGDRRARHRITWSTPPTARCSRTRHSADARRTLVGFDDDFADAVATRRFCAHGSTPTGAVELGVIGVGDWAADGRRRRS